MIFIGVMVGLVMAVVYSFIGIIPAVAISVPIYILWRVFDEFAEFESVIDKVMIPIIIISFIFGMYSAIPMVMIDTVEWGEPECYVTHEIINLADNNEINGRFRGRYVRGYVGEETIYHYYYERPDGGLDLQKANAKTTIIYYTDGEPHADWYRQERTYWWNTIYQYSCKIYIPEGTMSTEFVIDME